MKKFEFSLEKVLRYKSHLQKIEKEALAFMNLQRLNLMEEQVLLKERYEQCKLQLFLVCESGANAKEITDYNRYLTELKNQMKLLGERIEALNRQIDAQIKKVLGITMDKSSLEKLREKYVDGYEFRARKEEEQFIDEFIANSATAS